VTGKLQLDMRSIDPAVVVKAAIDTVLPAAEAKSIRVTTSFDHHGVRVAADPDRLQQVFWNLVSNAIKFTPAGGEIGVSVSSSDNQLVVDVRDSGEGIDLQFLPFVFDRFRQGRQGVRGRGGPGLGLGLAIAKHLVELHGGTLLAHSEGAGLKVRDADRPLRWRCRLRPCSSGQTNSRPKRASGLGRACGTLPSWW